MVGENILRVGVAVGLTVDLRPRSRLGYPRGGSYLLGVPQWRKCRRPVFEPDPCAAH